jgi:hypothetical protein
VLSVVNTSFTTTDLHGFPQIILLCANLSYLW